MNRKRVHNPNKLSRSRNGKWLAVPYLIFPVGSNPKDDLRRNHFPNVCDIQSYLNNYFVKSYRNVNGNLSADDTYNYRGRGYVQLTGRALYQKLEIVVPGLLQNPDAATVPDNAYKIMSYGMRHGSFTTRALPEFINSDKCDYENARRVINSKQSKAKEIADYAKIFEDILKSSHVNRY